MKSPPVIVLAEHRICAEAFRRLLEPEFRVFAVSKDGPNLVDTVREQKAQLIVMEILLPSLNGLQAIRHLRKTDPGIKVVVLSAYSDPQYMMAAFRAGASAYVLKSQAPSDLMRAIRKVLEGGVYRPRRYGEKPFDATSSHLRGMVREALTEREREVLRLIAEGHTAKEIAARLKISAKTAEFHKYRIMAKLKLRTVVELTKYAIKHGVVSL